jgi:hypothetical protein
MVSTNVMAIDVAPFGLSPSDIGETPFFYQPSRIMYCRNCPPEVLKQLKDWEQLSLDDWNTAVTRKHDHNNSLMIDGQTKPVVKKK